MVSLVLIKSPHLTSPALSVLFRDMASEAGVSVPIGREVMVGMQIAGDLRVSARHCIVHQKSGQLWVLPLKTTHGTYLRRSGNRMLLQPNEEYLLQIGDSIEVGDSLIEVQPTHYGSDPDEQSAQLRRSQGVRSTRSVPNNRRTKSKTR